MKNQVSVWDTYVIARNGQLMHFDILVPATVKDATIVHQYGRAYLKSKGEEGQKLSTEECRFCHVETLQDSWEKEIEEKGYFIIEMEGCN